MLTINATVYCSTKLIGFNFIVSNYYIVTFSIPYIYTITQYYILHTFYFFYSTLMLLQKQLSQAVLNDTKWI